MATLSGTKRVNAKATNTVAVWDLPLRLFHWSLVLAVTIAFLSSEEESYLNNWHVAAGWIAGLLIVFRLVWGFVGGEHSRFTAFVRPSAVGHHITGLLKGRAKASLGHNPLGGISVLVLLVLIGATVWTGAFGGESLGELHEGLAWTLLAFVALHVLAVIAMSVLEKENLVRAMITGTKRATRHTGASQAASPGLISYVIAGAVMAGAVFALLQYDPAAFTLRSSETFEHRVRDKQSVTEAQPHLKSADED